MKQYLASIPAISEPEPISLMEITPLPGSFPDDVVTENIRWGSNYQPVQRCWSERQPKLARHMSVLLISLPP